MPTMPPPPVEEPKSDLEKQARDNALLFMARILRTLEGFTYNTRSHVPGGNDCTDFFACLNKVNRWIHERPDWNLVVIEEAFKVVEFPLLEWVAKDPNVAKELAVPVK